MSYLVGVLTAGSVAVGAAATGWQTLLVARQSRTVREEVRKLAQGQERQVLQSNSIDQLGSYLYNNIGPTRIANYVGNKEVRGRVSRALNGVLSFLGTEDTAVSEEDSELVAQEANEPDMVHALQESRSRVNGGNGETSEMAKALEDITYGEVWNGLARMRRYIEIQLNQYASNLDPALTDRDRPLSVGRLLTTLVRLGYVSERSEKQLRYALNVANAGVHGNDISVAQAQEAWEAGVRGLALLSLPD